MHNYYYFNVKYCDDYESITRVDTFNRQYAIKHMQEHAASASAHRNYDVSFNEITPLKESLDAHELKELNLKKKYFESENCKLLRGEIEKRNKDFTEDQLDSILTAAASIYYGYIGKDENAWEDAKLLIANLPYITSICELVGKTTAKKIIYIVPAKSKETVKNILNKHGIELEITDASVNGNFVSIITFYREYACYDEMRGDKTAHDVFSEIERGNGIKCSYYYIPWSEENSYRTDLHGIRELGLDKKVRDSNAGIRDDLGRMFRSSWEANIARILNAKHIEWEYEKRMFPISAGYYRPDFFLSNNIVIEVKGFWDTESLKRVAAFRKEISDYQMLIIDSDMYVGLERKYGAIIPHWESDADASYTENTLKVVGLSFVKDQSVFDTLSSGNEAFLVREPDNKYDKNAILATTAQGRPLGYVSAEWAAVYSPKMDLGMKYKARITAVQPKYIDIKVKRENTEDDILFSFFL